MKYKTIFFLFISAFLISSESIQHLSISEFQKYITNSESKKKFLKDYLEELTLLDKDTNSIISLYNTDQLYRSYVYAKNKDWHANPYSLHKHKIYKVDQCYTKKLLSLCLYLVRSILLNNL